MTSEERKLFAELRETIRELRESNAEFKEGMVARLEATEKKVEQKHVPLVLEDKIVEAVEANISKALADSLTGYQSPLHQYALNVIKRYQDEIETIFNEVVAEGIKSPDFKQRVREVLLHKIAKTVSQGIDGTVDKTVNLMKQDQVFRSKLTLAINTVVGEYIHERKD